jgi:hypothetical protein
MLCAEISEQLRENFCAATRVWKSLLYHPTVRQQRQCQQARRTTKRSSRHGEDDTHRAGRRFRRGLGCCHCWEWRNQSSEMRMEKPRGCARSVLAPCGRPRRTDHPAFVGALVFHFTGTKEQMNKQRRRRRRREPPQKEPTNNHPIIRHARTQNGSPTGLTLTKT